MKQKRKILPKLFAALVVLTLISCCFLGTTFARYTSTGKNLASVEVANWDIKFENASSASLDENIKFGQLSPSKADAGAGTTRSNSTAPKLVAVIKNNSEVNAKVSVTVGDVTLSALQGSLTYGSGSDTENPTEDQVKALFKIDLYYHDTSADIGSTDDLNKITLSDGKADVKTLTVGSGAIYLYAVLTWTTDDTNTSAAGGWYGDALDTWVGENVAGVSYAVTYTAVQASQTPASGS